VPGLVQALSGAKVSGEGRTGEGSLRWGGVGVGWGGQSCGWRNKTGEGGEAHRERPEGAYVI
jgi:hypothetical protein